MSMKTIRISLSLSIYLFTLSVCRSRRKRCTGQQGKKETQKRRTQTSLPLPPFLSMYTYERMPVIAKEQQ